MELKSFLTEEQHMRMLNDYAMFSEMSSVRIRAINQLMRVHGVKAIPVIIEIIDSLPHGDQTFRAFCLKAMEKVKGGVETYV